jgi:hypothetical protein
MYGSVQTMLPIVRTPPHIVGAIHVHTLAQHNHSMLIARVASVPHYCKHVHRVREVVVT